MKIDILTLFPEMFNGFKESSIIKRAINKGLVDINIINFRDYSKLNNKQVDDAPYGGGAGMVLMCDPIVRAIEDLRSNDSLVILLCPQGKMFNQKKVKKSKETLKEVKKKVAAEIMSMNAIACVVGFSSIFLFTYIINELFYMQKGLHLLFFSKTGWIGFILCDIFIIVPLILSKGTLMGKADVTEF